MNAIIILTIVGVICMLSGLYKITRTGLVTISSVGLLASLVSIYLDYGKNYMVFNNMLHFDNYAVVFSGLLVLGALLIILVGHLFFESIIFYIAEHFALLIFSLVGMLIISSFSNFATLFVGIEILSISLYILAGSSKREIKSSEASIKYFLMGAFASGIILMGITLIYGVVGSFDLNIISNFITVNPEIINDPLLIGGILMLVAGLSFKISAVPFHFWAPDVYEGSPTLVTLFMSTLVKVAGVVAFYRLFVVGFSSAVEVYTPIISVIAILSVIVGTVSALTQSSVKRMLAYSGIANAGYMLITIILSSSNSAQVLFFYGATYTLASIGCFYVIMYVEKSTGSDSIVDFTGLAKRAPLMALVMLLSLISLAGLPLSGGFFAKYFVLSASFKQGMLVFPILAVINAAVGIAYYFKIVVAMYFKDTTISYIIPVVPFPVKALLLGLSFGVVFLGLFPDLFLGLL